MQAQYNHLRELGIDNQHIFAEAFGPASLICDNSTLKALPVAEAAIINFTETQVEQAWSKGDGTLLEFAEAHGLNPEFGCRSGQCGACKTTLCKGEVSYLQEVSADLGEGEFLLCCAVPAASASTVTEVVYLDIKL